MEIVKQIGRMEAIVQRLKGKNTIGLVPTMGALHSGHLSLIKKARQECGYSIVSIFVNPWQFGAKEDFKIYPRPIKKDLKLCRESGVDIVFYPKPKDMYPVDFKTHVAVEKLSNLLCGASRPGHFLGVTTVVCKLLNIIQPNIAYFGQKDAQQVIIIKRMVQDLNIRVKIKTLPIVRESDGLAMSSRNIYLNSAQRQEALCLYRALRTAKKLVKSGVNEAASIKKAIVSVIQESNSAKTDYIAIVDERNLSPVKCINRRILIALAVYFGKTRLIDNVVVRPKP